LSLLLPSVAEESVKSILYSFTLMVLFGLAGMCAPPACPASTTLDVLILLGSTGCEDGDKVFHDFNYSGDDASSVNAVLIAHDLSNGEFTFGNIHGWSFTRAGGPWTSSFKIGFTVNVDTSADFSLISHSKDQINTGLTGVTNPTTVVDTQTSATLSMNGLSPAGETAESDYANIQSITTSSVVTIPAGGLLVRYNQLFRALVER
jgi:hypothetical protein